MPQPRKQRNSDGGENNRPRFTPEIDKRLIEGFLDDREAILRALEQDGFGRDAIQRRARVLGLTEKTLEQVRMNRRLISVRRCLRCEKEFLSLGPQNRFCVQCRFKETG